MRILIVEDEPALAATVARGLRGEGMAVDTASDGASALEKLDVNDYDVVVLDRDLPGVHGDDVCRHLSQSGATTRILMLTAAGSIGAPHRHPRRPRAVPRPQGVRRAGDAARRAWRGRQRRGAAGAGVG
jgi:CheY-like chemotaxis protein